MSFLHLWAAAFGLSIAIPILLHLRRRRTDRRVSFPALRYLSRAEDARSRSLVASDLLLLAVRVGLLLALAAAAAGPLLGRGGAGDHEPTDLALVVDNSASAGRLDGDRLLLETLVERARASLAAARPEDRIWLFPTVGEPLAAGVGAVRALAALDALEATDGAAELTEAVERAAAALPADAGRRREVQLVSDLQASALRAGTGSGAEAVPLLAYVPSPPAEANGALVDIELTGGATASSGVGHGVIVRTRLSPGDDAASGGDASSGGASSGDQGGGGADAAGAGEANLRLEIDGRLAGAARAPWGADAALGLPTLAPGLHAGRVEVDPAGARADDARHFAIRVVPPPSARLYGDGGSFVALAIETLREAGRLGGANAGGGAGEGGGANRGGAVAVVESGGAAGAMPGAPWPGASTIVLLPPASPVDLPAFNQGLAAAGVGWRAEIDAAAGDLGLEPPPGATFSLQGVRVRQRYVLAPVVGTAAGDTALARTDDGEPWLVRAEARGRRALLLASPLTAEASDLPAHPAMIPFLEALLVHWSHVATWPFDDFGAGQPMTLPEWADEIEGPTGGTRAAEGGAPFTPLRAGVYAVRGVARDGTPMEARFAANVPPSEADPAPAAERRLSERFGGRRVTAAGPEAEAWEGAIFLARRGSDAAPWLVALALALACAELLLATPGRARRSRPAPSGAGAGEGGERRAGGETEAGERRAGRPTGRDAATAPYAPRA